MRRILIALVLMITAFGTSAGPGGFVRSTVTTVVCTPDPVTIHATATCTVTVTENNTGGPQGGPAGTATFSTSGTGDFTTPSCALVDQNNGSSACQVNYTPVEFNGGSHTISASYGGGANPNLGPGVVWQASGGNTALGLVFPSISISGISPGAGVRGDTVNVTVNGSGFVAGSTTLSLGANIAVTGIVVNSPTQLTATLDIAFAAAPGFRDVTVTNPAPGGNSATLVSGFEVRNPVPAITNLSPSSVEEGSGAVTVIVSGSNFVPDSIAYFNGAPRTTTVDNSGQLQMELTAADTSAVGDFNVFVRNPAPGGGDSNNAIFSVVSSGGSFNAVEAGQAVNGRLFTKLAGVAFNVDLLATDVGRTAINTSFSGDVRVELLDATDDSAPLDANGCRASWGVLQDFGTHAFGGGDNGRINVAVLYAGAARIARFRISHPIGGAPSHVGCSSDAFSIRPQELSLSSPLTNGGTGGAPIHPAGAPFSMSATGVAGYDGLPQIDGFSAHAGAMLDGTLSGAFPAANPVNGESLNNAFSYDEVGNFSFASQDVYDDSFTAVDQPNDCTDDFSNALSGGQYGCTFGNIDPFTVGRFVPDHFDVTVTDGCSADGFTYSAQPFTVNVIARDAAGNRTRNFHYSATPVQNFAKPVTLSDQGDTTNFDIPDNEVLSMFFDEGAATVNTVVYRFPDAETVATTITLRGIDGDGVSSAGHLEESTNVHSGRLAMTDATSITTSDGFMDVLVQTWQEAVPGVFSWEVHAADDACTNLGPGDFSLDAGSYTGNLSDGDTLIVNFNYAAGEGTLALSAPGADNAGSVDVEVTVEDWLHFDWTGGGPEAPRATMQFFEIFETEPGFIHREEIVN